MIQNRTLLAIDSEGDAESGADCCNMTDNLRQDCSVCTLTLLSESLVLLDFLDLLFWFWI